MAQETAMLQADILGTNRERGVSALGPLPLPGYGVYDAADGHVFLMAMGTAGAGFPGLVEFMDQTGDAADLLSEPYKTFTTEGMNTNEILAAVAGGEGLEYLAVRLGHVDEVVRAFCLKHPKLYLYEEGQRRRILVGIVNSPVDILESPQLNARDWFVELDDPGRGVSLRYPGPPWQLQGTPADLRRPAPLLGEHNQEIFTALGISSDDLSALARSGVVSQ